MAGVAGYHFQAFTLSHVGVCLLVGCIWAWYNSFQAGQRCVWCDSQSDRVITRVSCDWRLRVEHWWKPTRWFWKSSLPWSIFKRKWMWLCSTYWHPFCDCVVFFSAVRCWLQKQSAASELARLRRYEQIYTLWLYLSVFFLCHPWFLMSIGLRSV